MVFGPPSPLGCACAAAASLAIGIVACGSRTGLLVPAPGETCPDPSTPIYVLAAGPSPNADDVLMRFDPSTGAFTTVTSVPCLGYVQLPMAMAIDRAGEAYIVGRSAFNGQLFRVSTATGACELTAFTPRLASTSMAFSDDRGGASETLYAISEGPPSWDVSLSAVDPSTFTSRDIGQDGGTPWQSSVGYGPGSPFLTGTGAGDLFAAGSFSEAPLACEKEPEAGAPPPGLPCTPDTAQPPPPLWADIARIDKSDASATTQWTVTTSLNLAGAPLQGFAAWGGDFYFFAPRGSGSLVVRFRPSDQSTVQVGQTDAAVLAVGVSTCAPF